MNVSSNGKSLDGQSLEIGCIKDKNRRPRPSNRPTAASFMFTQTATTSAVHKKATVSPTCSPSIITPNELFIQQSIQNPSNYGFIFILKHLLQLTMEYNQRGHRLESSMTNKFKN